MTSVLQITGISLFIPRRANKVPFAVRLHCDTNKRLLAVAYNISKFLANILTAIRDNLTLFVIICEMDLCHHYSSIKQTQTAIQFLLRMIGNKTYVFYRYHLRFGGKTINNFNMRGIARY